MANVDPETFDFYRQNSSAIAAQYEAVESPVAKYFPLAFPNGARVLDIGCGSGRDLARLLVAGHDAYGVDPVPEMLHEAKHAHPELAGRVWESALPDLDIGASEPFDGVLCSAALMHVPDQQLFDAAFNIRRVLKQHGRLLLSIPASRFDVQSGRDQNRRLFSPFTPEQILLLFERLGFQSIGRWETSDAMGRNHVWATLLLELRIGSALRPVDQIEGILNRDKKVATYKLALFRALAEIAIQQPHVAKWHANGEVGIGVRTVAERWLAYYWSIVKSGRFFPQTQGERPDSQRPVKFRRSLHALTERFDQSGGLTAFSLAFMSGELAEDRQTEHVLREIEQTIIAGPVKYAGGALTTGRLFRYSEKQIILPAEIWREVCLMGHWINDAVILRWAELSVRLGKSQGISVSEITERLVTVPDPARETFQARAIYASQKNLECVWTGKSLAGGFEADHVIPYSLWRNNQLWNLLPAAKDVNREKSDRIPTSALLVRRQDAIVNCWKLMRRDATIRFDVETERFLGVRTRDWETQLFGKLRESAELTALQRGAERWEPAVHRK